MSCVHHNAQSTYAVSPSQNRKPLAESVRQARMLKLAKLLDQAGRILTVLEPDKPILDHHAALLDWAKSRPTADVPPPKSTLGSTLADVIARRETR